MNLFWYEGDLHVLGRNKVFALLIRKANRADKFWEWIERFNPLHWRAQ